MTARWAACVAAAMLAGCGDSGPSGPDEPLTVAGAQQSRCPDGSECPLPSGLGISRCPDNTGCTHRTIHVTSDPAAITCGTGAGETTCEASFAHGTTVHLTVGGGRDPNCYIVTCFVDAGGTCDAIVMDGARTVSLGCYNP